VTSAEEVRAVELERLRALVDADIERARELHADDFRLIVPSGDELDRDEYLGRIASRDLHYLAWEPGEIEVRLYPESGAAVIRYRSEIEMRSGGREAIRRTYRHTDLYERRGGRWQVVWSQATEAH
jgi:hypothetical protein